MGDLGVELQAIVPLRASSAIAASGALPELATALKPVGQFADAVTVTHPHVRGACRFGQDSSSNLQQSAVMSTWAWPNSRSLEGSTHRRAARPSFACRNRCRAPARPSRRRASGARGGLSKTTDSGPRRGRHRPGRSADQRRIVVPRQYFAVHARFAHTPRDQLRVLRTKIENQDAIARGVFTRHGSWAASLVMLTSCT